MFSPVLTASHWWSVETHPQSLHNLAFPCASLSFNKLQEHSPVPGEVAAVESSTVARAKNNIFAFCTLSSHLTKSSAHLPVACLKRNVERDLMKPKKKNNAFRNSEFFREKFQVFPPACLRSGPQWKSLTVHLQTTTQLALCLQPCWASTLLPPLFEYVCFQPTVVKSVLLHTGTLRVRRVTPARRPRQQNQTQALTLMTGPLGLKLRVSDGDDGADWCVGGSFGGWRRGNYPQTVIAAERRRRCESSRGQKKRKKRKRLISNWLQPLKRPQ